MDGVLGLSISPCLERYSALCLARNIKPSILWRQEQPRSFVRYEWQEFLEFCRSLELALDELGVTVLEFQRIIIPTLLRTMAGHFLLFPGFNLKKIAELITNWIGPFLFKGVQSKFESHSKDEFSIELAVKDFKDSTSSRYFLRQCFFGYVSQFELVAGSNFEIVRFNLTETTMSFRVRARADFYRPNFVCSEDEILNLIANIEHSFLLEDTPPRLDDLAIAVDLLIGGLKSFPELDAKLIDHVTVMYAYIQIAMQCSPGDESCNAFKQKGRVAALLVREHFKRFANGS